MKKVIIYQSNVRINLLINMLGDALLSCVNRTFLNDRPPFLLFYYLVIVLKVSYD